jgi:hypothetical protein
MKIMTLAFACLLLAVGNARAGIFVTLSDQEWGSVNVTTGVFTPLGMSPVQMGDIAINPITQQAYGIGFDNNLYAINTATGSGVIMGPSIYTNNLGASIEGGLYEINGDLLKVNPTNGSVTDLGFFASHTIYDLAFNATDKIFATDSTNIYERALGASGPASLLGNTGFSEVYGLAFENHVLYGFGMDDGIAVLFSVNQSTGVGTVVAPLSGGDFETGAIVFGAASSLPLGAVPEPSSIILLGVGCLLSTAYSAQRNRGSLPESLVSQWD